MINCIKNIANLVLFLHKISKYQILTYPEKIKIPRRIRFLAGVVCLIIYPKRFFITPKQAFGIRLANFFKDLGPIYIKFGQTLSTRPDLIGRDVAHHLKSLQDKLSPFDSKIAKNKIEETFGTKISEIFSSFNDIPVAAASIAQVHKAVLVTGEKVAVKILRPDITKTYNNDIIFLEFIADFTARFVRNSQRLKPREVIAVFRESMNCELNLLMEAAAASRLADNFALDKSICIPKIYWELTSEEIITLEWINGISIYNREKLIKNKLNPDDIAAKIAVIFFNQAYRDGFFHADLHPGNILVKKNGEIALIDFGIIGILSEDDRLAIAEILYAFLKRDYKLVASVHHRISYIPKNTNLELFAQRCRAIAEPIIGKQIKNISIGNLLAQLFKITEEFGMETQPQLLLLQKTVVVVEGIGQSLDPEINMWQLAEPWIKKWAAKNLTPEAKLLRIAKKFINRIAEDL
ncbi:MAG: 2-polyprenylphenol 6-hydroxylase [Alphaproteobacteria bacterium]|jgi:ubiquinone biosynthesis protein|nr:2-polyprenylphenol 6-hydroxylase [Alphaproteobacteria bacterium]